MGGGGSASADEASDAEVVVAMAAGDASRLAVLHDRYAPTTLALILRIVGQRARAEELLQEVFLQVWRHAADYEATRGSVAAWIFTFARNRALDVVRSSERRRTDLDADVSIFVDDAARPPDGEAARGQRGRAVRAAIACLTAPQRQAIELAYFEGLSHSEIAARLHEPLGTIKSRIGQSMARLRSSLAEHRDDDR